MKFSAKIEDTCTFCNYKRTKHILPRIQVNLFYILINTITGAYIYKFVVV